MSVEALTLSTSKTIFNEAGKERGFNPSEAAAPIKHSLQRALMVWPSMRQGQPPTLEEVRRVTSYFLKDDDQLEEEGWVIASAKELVNVADKAASLAALDQNRRQQVVAKLVEDSPNGSFDKKKMTKALSQLLSEPMLPNQEQETIKKLIEAAQPGSVLRENILFVASEWAGLAGHPQPLPAFDNLPGPSAGEPLFQPDEEDRQRQREVAAEFRRSIRTNPSERRWWSHMNVRVAAFTTVFILTFVSPVRERVAYPLIRGLATNPIAYVLSGVSDEFTINKDPIPDKIRLMFDKPYSESPITLEGIAIRQFRLVKHGEPLALVRDPKNWNEQQEAQISVLISQIKDELAVYKKSHGLSDEEYRGNYVNIFSQVLCNTLGIESPSEACRVLAIFAKSYQTKTPLNDEEWVEVKKFHEQNP